MAATIDASFQSAVEDSLRFTWHGGAVTKVSPGYTSGWRTLPFSVVAQPLGAAGELRLAGSRTRIRIPAGAAPFLPARMHHRVDTLDPGFVSRWAHVTFTLFSSVDVLAMLGLPYVLDRATARRAGDVCEALVDHDRATHNGPGSDLLSHAAKRLALGFQLLEILSGAAPAARRAAMFDLLDPASRVLPVLRFLEEHLAGPDLDRDALADVVHLSPTRFHAVFKEATGLAPVRYLKQLRLRRAQHLLAATDTKVSAVGCAVGYADAFHFSRTFKAATGRSPAAYRTIIRTTAGDGV